MIGGDHSGPYKFCASVRVTGVGKVTGKLENALCMVPAEIFCFEARNKIVARQFSFNGLSGRTSENEPVLSLPGQAGASVKVREAAITHRKIFGPEEGVRTVTELRFRPVRAPAFTGIHPRMVGYAATGNLFTCLKVESSCPRTGQ